MWWVPKDAVFEAHGATWSAFLEPRASLLPSQLFKLCLVDILGAGASFDRLYAVALGKFGDVAILKHRAALALAHELLAGLHGCLEPCHRLQRDKVRVAIW